MYGVTVGQIWKTGLRADARYSKFDGSFGKGSYRALSLSRHLREGMRAEVQIGQQFLDSPLSSQKRSRFLNANVDLNVGPRYFMQAGYTAERGGSMEYDQWSITTGYRFDNRGHGERR